MQNPYTNTATSTSVFPKIDFGLDLFTNPNVQQLVVRVNLAFAYANAKFNYPVYVDYNTITNYSFSFTQFTSALTSQLMFNIYNRDRFKVYIDGGVSLNLSSYSNNSITLKTSQASGITNTYDLQSSWVSFPFQTGMIFNQRLEIFLSYSPSSSFNDVFSNQSMCLGGKFLFK